MKTISLSIIAAGILAGCAGPMTRPTTGTSAQIDAEAAYQKELAVQQNIESNKRLYDVSLQLRSGASGLCESKVGPIVGMVILDPPNNENGAIVKRIYKLDGRASLFHVAKHSPAEKAGLRAGDVIVSMDGKEIKSSGEVKEPLNSFAIGKTYAIEYLRGTEKGIAAITPVAGCDYPAKLSESMDLNAFANGKEIIITQGMMGFTRTDEELALVVAHEIAHNMMAHLDAKKGNAFGGLLADIALAVLTRGAYNQATVTNAAAQAYSQEFEAEADYVGLYIMAKSGYRIDEAPQFWRRMAVAHPGSIKTNHTASHPSTAARMVALDAAVAEIKAKQAAGQPLAPNMKEGKVATASEQQ